MRMGFESLVIAAHAMGRTLVMPPHDDIYLLRSTFKEDEEGSARDEMGFLDFYDFHALSSQVHCTTCIQINHFTALAHTVERDAYYEDE